MSDEDSDDDFDELFADFNNDDDEVDEEDSNFIEAISANLRESVGFKQGEVVHKGDVDEGPSGTIHRITYKKRFVGRETHLLHHKELKYWELFLMMQEFLSV